MTADSRHSNSSLSGTRQVLLGQHSVPPDLIECDVGFLLVTFHEVVPELSLTPRVFDLQLAELFQDCFVVFGLLLLESGEEVVAEVAGELFMDSHVVDHILLRLVLVQVRQLLVCLFSLIIVVCKQVFHASSGGGSHGVQAIFSHFNLPHKFLPFVLQLVPAGEIGLDGLNVVCLLDGPQVKYFEGIPEVAQVLFVGLHEVEVFV